ncbi:two-component system, sensor histidine kinase and response regulator [Gammaproteobacteria bacterium]
MSPTNNIERRLVFHVALSLLILLLVITIFIYRVSFQKDITDSDNDYNILMNVVRIQAETAAYTKNEILSDGVVKGLLTNPSIIGVRLLGTDGFNYTRGTAANDDYNHGKHFELYSPIGSKKEFIGELIIVRSDFLIFEKAKKQALEQVAFLSFMVLITSIIIIITARRTVSIPLVQLAHEIENYAPHKGAVVSIPAGHKNDELGKIATSINVLIRTAESINRDLTLFRYLVENAHDLIHVTDINGRILDSSKAGWLALGYSKDELLQLGVWDVEATIPSRDAWQQVVTVLRQAGGIVANGIAMRKDGSRFSTEVRASLVVTEEGEFTLAILRDITERKQFEEKLLALEERSRLILSSVHDGIIGVDTDNVTIFANQAATTILGYTEEELMEHHLHNLVHHSHADGTKHSIEQCQIFQTAHNGLARLVKYDTLWHKGNVPFPVEYTTTPIYRNNTLFGSVFVFRDITERNKIEAKISKLEEQSRSVLLAVRDGIIYMDSDGRVTLANPAAISLLGYKEVDLIGQPMHATVHYAYPDRTEYPIEQCLMHQTLVDGQCRISDRDVLWNSNGQAIPVEYSTAPLYKHGVIAGTVIVFRDITGRKRAEEAILEAHRLQQAIFDSATIGISVACNRIILSYNKKFSELFGYDADELIGKATRLVYEDEETNSSVGAAYQDLQEGKIHTRIQKLIRKDGSTFICKMIGSSIIEKDISRGTVWTFSDITNEYENTKALHQAKEMAEEVARMKSDFLANMSHEIRTPMNAIIGMSHLALRTELTPRQQNYIKKIHASGQHLLGIINDILDISKIEAGKLTIDRVEFELESVLDNVSAIVFEKAIAKGIELIFDIDPAVPDYFIGDPLRLRQILINYMSNAIKFTEKGEICLQVLIHEENEQEILLRFSVKDTGVGLTEEQKKQLFKTFSQVDQSSTRRFGGTGLGLAISKKLAELMGGEVGVDSRYGRGSTFWVTVRLGRVANKPARDNMLASNRHHRRVLIVDDNRHTRMVLTGMLKKIGFTVEEVASGQDAIDAVRRVANSHHPYDLVTIDFFMAEMDGIETAKRICALGLEETPSLMIITSYGNEDVFTQADKIGIKEVLVKPVHLSALIDATVRIFSNLSQSKSEVIVTAQSSQLLKELETRKGARILLVEDDEFNQEIAITLLAEAGFVVDSAVNGAIAVQKVQQADYDLVLMDMQMPVMDGVTAAMEIRCQLPPFTHLPIVAMTANVMQQEKDQCNAAGMVDHISKPIELDELWRVLLRWIKPLSTTPSETVSETKATPTTTIPKISGLDIRAGLRRVMNNRPLYLSMLRMFFETQKSIPDLIVTALDTGNWEEAERMTHTLKGVSGSIGAHKLQKEVALLESLIKEKSQRTILDDQLSIVITYLVPLIVDLEEKLPPITRAIPNVIVDVSQVKDICAKLANQLINDDFGVHKTLETNADVLKVTFGEDYHKIEEGIRSFDFDSALQVLKNVAEQVGVFKQRKSRH